MKQKYIDRWLRLLVCVLEKDYPTDNWKFTMESYLKGVSEKNPYGTGGCLWGLSPWLWPDDIKVSKFNGNILPPEVCEETYFGEIPMDDLCECYAKYMGVSIIEWESIFLPDENINKPDGYHRYFNSENIQSRMKKAFQKKKNFEFKLDILTESDAVMAILSLLEEKNII